MASPPDLSPHILPLTTPLSTLQADEAFNGLSPKEKLYCHYLARAAWEGGPICLLQTSPESVPIFLLLKELFSRQSPASLRAAVGSEVTEDEFRALVLYAAGVFTNMGNYKGFGDTKIIPGIERVSCSNRFVGGGALATWHLFDFKCSTLHSICVTSEFRCHLSSSFLTITVPPYCDC